MPARLNQQKGESAMRNDEPPSPQSSSLLLQVGKDSHDHWVVRDPKGLRGGIFADRADALKFAMYETGHRPQAVIMVPGVLELEFNNIRQSARDDRARVPRHSAQVA